MGSPLYPKTPTLVFKKAMANEFDYAQTIPQAYLSAFANAVRENGNLSEVYSEIREITTSNELDESVNSRLCSLREGLGKQLSQMALVS